MSGPSRARETLRALALVGALVGVLATYALGSAAAPAAPVTPDATAPVVKTSTGTTAYREGDPAVPVDAGTAFSVTDPDSPTLRSARVRISAGFQPGELLLFSAQNGISGDYAETTGVLTLTGGASVAHYRTALRSVRYESGGNQAPLAGKTVEFTVSDGTATSAPATKGLALAAVNDPPRVSLPEAASTARDTRLPFTDAAAIRVLDPDAGAGAIKVALAATNGTLTMTLVTGLTFSAGDGSGDRAMTFTGPLSRVNAALATLAFSPSAGFPGTAPTGGATVTVTANDQGRSGTGGALSDSNAVAVTVFRGPLPPPASAPASLGVLLVGAPSALTAAETRWLADLRRNIGAVDTLAYAAATPDALARYLTIFVTDIHPALKVSALTSAFQQGRTIHLLGPAAAYGPQVTGTAP